MFERPSDFCEFSGSERNSFLVVNNQAAVVMSNCLLSRCGSQSGAVTVKEGSSVNIINSEITDCSGSCIAADDSASVSSKKILTFKELFLSSCSLY